MLKARSILAETGLEGNVVMKNIAICCDGTGNEISENISNVLKLYRVLRKTDKTEPAK